MTSCKANNTQKVKLTKICTTDTTPCTIRCPKCELYNKSHAKILRNPQNLWRHLWQTHSFDRNDYPSNDLVIKVLEEITSALHNGISIEKVVLARKWNMIVK